MPYTYVATFLSLQKVPPSSFPVGPTLPLPVNSVYLPSVAMSSPVLKLHMNVIIRYVLSCIWFPLLNTMCEKNASIFCVYPFLFFCKKYSIVGICHNLFTHSPPYEHLDCFQISAIMNKDTVNILTQIFLWTSVLITPGYLHRSRMGRS